MFFLCLWNNLITHSFQYNCIHNFLDKHPAHFHKYAIHHIQVLRLRYNQQYQYRYL